MPSDDLFHTTQSQTQSQWDLLETRIHRLLENILLLRDINSRLKQENHSLKEELQNIQQNSSQQELEALRHQHEEALRDLQQVKQNLQRIEILAHELNLEGY